MRNLNLPEEILIEIFSMLPAKSVGVCRCLSRSWRARLSNSEFLSLHFTRKPRQENLILVEKPDESITTDHPVHIISSPISEEAVSKKLDLPNTWVEVVGSSNGLVLMLDDDEMFLVNPVLKEQVKMPSSPFEPWNRYDYNKGFRYEEMYGFGYDSSTDDYKIVKLSTYSRWLPRRLGTAVDIYSVKAGRWKRNHFDIYVLGKVSGAFVNGALHWVGLHNDPTNEWLPNEPSNESPVIFALDLASEEFHEIPSPSHVDELFKYGNTFVLRDCLCIIELKPTMTLVIDAWMMNVYGLQESWTKFSLYAENLSSSLRPLCYGEDEDQLVCFNSAEEIITVCNLKDQTRKKMLVNGAILCIHDACVFVESLVSPCQLLASFPCREVLRDGIRISYALV